MCRRRPPPAWHAPALLAGNSARDACRVSPGSTPNAITVAAIDVNRSRWAYANWCAAPLGALPALPALPGRSPTHQVRGLLLPCPRRGACVDVFAPGVSILSAVPTSDTSAGLKTGTSMAARERCLLLWRRSPHAPSPGPCPLACCVEGALSPRASLAMLCPLPRPQPL